MANDYEDKIKLIDKISSKHPSYGTEKGWSKYVGGMADTGEWFFRKMLDVPMEELQAFYDSIIAEENKPPRIYTEQEQADMGIIHRLPNGDFITEFERKQRRDFNNDYEKRFLG